MAAPTSPDGRIAAHDTGRADKQQALRSGRLQPRCLGSTLSKGAASLNTVATSVAGADACAYAMGESFDGDNVQKSPRR
jgi:hypothetical protein